jgi:hypothetical protein
MGLLRNIIGHHGWSHSRTAIPNNWRSIVSCRRQAEFYRRNPRIECEQSCLLSGFKRRDLGALSIRRLPN